MKPQNIIVQPDIDSFALPGEPVSEEDFRKWIEYAENTPTVSLFEAKQRWATQKKTMPAHFYRTARFYSNYSR